jgi:hypothetical protein
MPYLLRTGIPVQRILMLTVATCLTLLASSTIALARTRQPTATVSSAALHRALVVRASDKRALAQASFKLHACTSTHFESCASQRRGVHQAHVKLADIERLIKSFTGRIARRHHGFKGGSSSNGSSGGSTYGGSKTGGAPGSGTDEATSRSGTSGTDTNQTSGSSSSTGAAGTSGSSTGAGNSGNETSTSRSGTGTEGSSASTGSTSNFEMGVVAGSAPVYELPFIQKLGAHTARIAFDAGTSTSQMEATIEAYASAGIRPLPLVSFYGTLPTPAQAQSLGTWAARFGPGGSFWKGKDLPTAGVVTSIEFGNETSYEYQYSDDSPAGYASRAQTYALRFKEAAEAIQAANPNVGLLAQGDPGNAPGTSWMDNMFKAVPNLGSLVAGWTVHPYGPNWQSIIDEVVSSAKADGAPSSIPLDVTEWGLSTDNGRCLEENYGFNPCMTYAEAATTLTTNVAAMRARYGSRLASLYLFQARNQEPTGASTGREGYFGALQSDEAPKGDYTTAVESLLSANP